ncbi:TPA: iron-containing alcohol dehydrogenase, partial [Escherichia coli]|nr:alcohol dehydrogenase [Escherichia coli]
MVIINSTILSGAGAIPSLTSLLPDIRKMLLVTDRNIAQLDGVQQIRALLEKHCPQV